MTSFPLYFFNAFLDQLFYEHEQCASCLVFIFISVFFEDRSDGDMRLNK